MEIVFFFIKLIADIANSLLRMIGQLVNFYFSLILVIGFSLLLISIWQLQPDKMSIAVIAPAAETNLSSEISFWQTQLTSQPNSRDVLWNLGQLELANHQPNLAQQYLDQAKQLDPNFQFSTP